MKGKWYGKGMKTVGLLLSVVLIVLMTACGSEDEDALRIFQVYYIDKDGSGLVSEEYEMDTSNQNTVDTIQQLLVKLQTHGSKGQYKNPIQPDIEINDFMIREMQLSLYFTAAYNNKTGISEILARAAIVKTLCQISAIDYVEFYIEDQPLTLSGNVVGLMDASTFVDKLNPEFKEQKKQVILYFSDESGQNLSEISLQVTYSAAEPLAGQLLEKLIAGPEELEDNGQTEELKVKRTLPSGTSVNSVTIRDKICYVDLSSEFMNLPADVKSDVTVYSIVNTLCELSNVNKVQFTVDGEQWEKYGETDNFNTPYERNLDIVTQGASIWVNP